MKKMVQTDGDRFIDVNGNHVILHGINMVCKDKTKNYIGSWDCKDFQKLKEWGINVIRLGVIWDGIEPEPGLYDLNYLKEMDKFVKCAKENQIYVFLDMHQDLFSVAFSDGAPEWATITDGLNHDIGGEVWSDAYFSSAAVQRSFDNFWNNKLTIVQKGVQTHYIELWKMLADRYKSEPYIIGYDLMNEPFVGSLADSFMGLLLNNMEEILSYSKDINEFSELNISEKWLDADSRNLLLQQFSDSNDYAKLIDVTEDLLKAFDKNKLTPFYSKLTNAIREVDNESLIFLESNYFGNLGIRSGLNPILDDNNNRVNNQVYAPHGYDVLTDTEYMKNANLSRIELIFKRHHETSKRLKMPLMIGEWGAFQSFSGLKNQADYTAKLFENFLCSDTYWCYNEKINFENQSFFASINRSYPMKVAGIIKKYNTTLNYFSCHWEEKSETKQDSWFYIKDIHSVNNEDIKLEPNSHFNIIKNKSNNSGYLVVQNSEKNCFRRLEVSFEDDN